MSVPQYTTPTFTLTFTEEGLDLTQAQEVFVTFRSCDNVITKTDTDLTVDEKTIEVTLNQEDTARFLPGTVEIQANWITSSGGRIASEVVSYLITEQLLKKVIEE